MVLGAQLLQSLVDLPGCNISTANKQQLTEIMSQQLRSLPLAEAALACGYLSDTLSTAFFFGYQCAVRRLDPVLENYQFAAFAASEKGIRSSRDFETSVIQRGEDQIVCGTKSHVMLLERELLDAVYVLANNQDSQLVCLKVLTSDEGFTPQNSTKEQTFLKDVLHTPVVFDHCACEPGYYLADAHQRAFKPFRYWEDVMVSLSYAGWLIRTLSDAHSTSMLTDSASTLIESYNESPDYFSQSSLSLINKLATEMKLVSKELPSSFRQEWQQDSALLMLGAVAREKVKAKL